MTMPSPFDVAKRKGVAAGYVALAYNAQASRTRLYNYRARRFVTNRAIAESIRQIRQTLDTLTPQA